MKNWLDKMELQVRGCICNQKSYDVSACRLCNRISFEFYDATASYLFYTGTGTDFERAGVATSKLGDHPAE